MNAPVTQPCEGCGKCTARHTLNGFHFCGACFSEALDPHEEPEPDSDFTLGLTDRAGRL